LDIRTSDIPPDKRHNGDRPGWQHWVALVAVIVLICGLALFGLPGVEFDLPKSQEMVIEHITELGVWGQLAIFALMIVHSFIPFPAEFVALAAGACFGIVHGTLLTWSGAMAGAFISFWITRFFGRPFVNYILPKRQRKLLDDWTEDQGATTLLVSRFIPVIAFNLINYAAGLTKVSWWTFAWTTSLGILPLTVLMVYLGARMKDLSWHWLVGISVVGIVMMAIYHIHLRRRTNG
jgi:uncharacterized membrane protein YdjX (TVP38/TMEM64 family)